MELEALKEGVRKSLPEIGEIQDPVLREKVAEAWALSLSKTEFTSIEQMIPAAVPGKQIMRQGTQADHLRGVARMALGMAEGLHAVVGALDVDRDLLLAAALCHDLGKPFEFSPENRARWSGDPARWGEPSLRHPVYGTYVALTAGLPEEVAHVCAAHSMEGDNVKRSLIATIVHFADYAYWDILERAGLASS